MQQVALVAFVALLLYLALRVWRMKRPSMPLLIAYPVFLLIMVGGGLVVFIAMSYAAEAYRLSKELTLVAIYGTTTVSLFILWFIARRFIG